ncbi:MAG: hypothetical protein LBQ66_02010 [Planctomycetaceae bacterium]|jgi:hypothetical protein|nr:hypothetical protein [Planctomycetaceae bacterium]
MIVRCRFDKFEQLPVLIRHYGFLPSSVSTLTRGKLYAVYAIIYSGIPYRACFNMGQYLVIDDDLRPFLFPTLMFDMVCPHIYGRGWCFRHFAKRSLQDSKDSILGYEQLVDNVAHFNQVILDESEGRKIFEQWKISVDNAMKNTTCSCNVVIETAIT